MIHLILLTFKCQNIFIQCSFMCDKITFLQSKVLRMNGSDCNGFTSAQWVHQTETIIANAKLHTGNALLTTLKTDIIIKKLMQSYN